MKTQIIKTFIVEMEIYYNTKEFMKIHSTGSGKYFREHTGKQAGRLEEITIEELDYFKLKY